MIEKLLIANRGEIAVRVARTARAMGIRTVAVYSRADADALHVASCDEALPVGGDAPKDSYLRIGAILAAAKTSGADAVHPGYGFLSENAEFAQACADAGLVFVGPPPAAIRAMGGKSAAKALMVEAGVPVVPGYHGDAQDIATLAGAAAAIGYPVLVKASAGGGGKGMRIVASADALEEAVLGARREAEAAFGNPLVLVEKYLDRPRHIEVQVFCDAHGNGVHLFERDCSLQRRHQKVIEEAPAPGMDEARRVAMGAAAVRAAKAVGYVGAGTVEFIADRDGTFYFMEMNTRLQVEHPVTEAITGQDLVEWQLRVAAGERLPKLQHELGISGHAFEARVYAEDPTRDFLPATGRLDTLVFPDDARVDTGVRQGDAVTIHYDPMIAKLVVHGASRAAALAKLATALERVRIAGVANNVAFLSAVARHKAFAAGEIDTGFIQRHRDALVPPYVPVDDTTLALAALGVLRARAQPDAASPWTRLEGWQLNGSAHDTLVFADGERQVTLVAHFVAGGYRLMLPGGPVDASAALGADGALAATIEGHRRHAHLVRHGAELTVFQGAIARTLVVVDRLAAADRAGEGLGRLIAPMPGRIVAVHVAPGQAVQRGQKLVVLEAMKMEHTILAPADGIVSRVRFAAGEQASEGEELVAFEEPPEAKP